MGDNLNQISLVLCKGITGEHNQIQKCWSSLIGLQSKPREFNFSLKDTHLLQSVLQPFWKRQLPWEGIPISDMGHSLWGKTRFMGQKLFSSIMRCNCSELSVFSKESIPFKRIVFSRRRVSSSPKLLGYLHKWWETPSVPWWKSSPSSEELYLPDTYKAGARREGMGLSLY